MKVTEKTGGVVGVAQVGEDDEVMLVTDRGRLIRLRTSDIRVTGRNAQGVKLLDVDDGERVVSLARVADVDERAGSPAEPSANGSETEAETEDGEASGEPDDEGGPGCAG